MCERCGVLKLREVVKVRRRKRRRREGEKAQKKKKKKKYQCLLSFFGGLSD